MRMGTARVPHLPAGLPTVPCWGPAGLVPIASFRGDHGRLCLRRRRGHSARPGAIRSRRGQPTRSGTGFPSPTASNVPGRTKMSPPATTCPRTRGAHPPAPHACTHPSRTSTHTPRTPPTPGTPPALTRRAGRSRPFDQPQPAPRTGLDLPSAAAFRRQNAATTAPSGQVLLM